MPKKLTPEQLAQEMLRRKKAQGSLLEFVEYTHPRWYTSWYHGFICDYLERLERGEIQQLAINAPPRHGKTELASRRFPAWCLGRHPDWQIISTSSGTDLANDIGADVRDIIRDPIYQNIFPEVSMRTDAGAAGRWRLNKGGIYVAGSVGSQIVGRGAMLGIIDDPHKGRAEADSERLRAVVSDWYFGDFLTRLMPPFLQLLIQTRWHQADLAGKLLGSEKMWIPADKEGFVFQTESGWTVIKLQAIYKRNGREQALGHRFFPLKKLRERRKTMMDGGRGREWRAQYQQEPVAEEGTVIKREWFDKRFEAHKYHKTAVRLDTFRIYLAADFAIRDAADARDPDRTEIGVFGLAPDDTLYVLDWWSGQVTPDVWIDQLINMFDDWKPRCFFGEKGPIRAITEPMLKRRMRERKVFCRLEWMPAQKDKLARGRVFEAWSSAGRIVIPDRSSWVDEWLEEIVAVPSGRYWDKFDTMAHMCLALDKTSPASQEEVDTIQRFRDYTDIASGTELASSWKVA